MIAIVQRVSHANVVVDTNVVGEIGQGILALVAVEAEDSATDIDWMAGKITSLRIFCNGEKHFDLDVTQIGGGILLVSNFTVSSETRYGRRPSFDAAAPPEVGRRVFDELVAQVKAKGIAVATGQFGADMKISLINDGPATFILNSRRENNRGSEK